jgi:hypothetical protein
MNDAERTEAVVRAIAVEAVVLIDENVARPTDPGVTRQPVAGAALARLSRLLDTQLAAPASDYEVFVLCARAVMETWLTGHASLLLGERGAQLLEERATQGQTSLEYLARLLDEEMYGESPRPKAFRRHLQSFFDEVDISGSEGNTKWLLRYLDDGAVPLVRTSPRPTDHPADFVRVGLWVTLFLAHGYFDAIGERESAKAARSLFDRLRLATDDFYSRRRSDAMRSGSAGAAPA